MVNSRPGRAPFVRGIRLRIPGVYPALGRSKLPVCANHPLFCQTCAMSVAEGIDLSDQAFWERSAAEREEAFAELRCDAPVSWQPGQSAGTRVPSSQFLVPGS